jgi:hypothetical protein
MAPILCNTGLYLIEFSIPDPVGCGHSKTLNRETLMTRSGISRRRLAAGLGLIPSVLLHSMLAPVGQALAQVE